MVYGTYDCVIQPPAGGLIDLLDGEGRFTVVEVTQGRCSAGHQFHIADGIIDQGTIGSLDFHYLIPVFIQAFYQYRPVRSGGDHLILCGVPAADLKGAVRDRRIMLVHLFNQNLGLFLVAENEGDVVFQRIRLDEDGAGIVLIEQMIDRRLALDNSIILVAFQLIDDDTAVVIGLELA